jgi:hypothetical protein
VLEHGKDLDQRKPRVEHRDGRESDDANDEGRWYAGGTIAVDPGSLDVTLRESRALLLDRPARPADR